MCVVVDMFTNMTYFVRVKNKAMGSDVAKEFLNNVWKIHELQKEIMLDIDMKFKGEFWKSLRDNLNIKPSEETT